MLRIRSNHYNELKNGEVFDTPVYKYKSEELINFIKEKTGKQYTVDINEVLHYEEEEPFEASCALEDVKHGKTFMINIAKKIIAL